MLYRLISKFSRKCDYEILSTMKKNLTYEELFEANVRLQEENNVLKDEIKHLKMQLHIDDKPQKSIAVTRLSLEKKVALFRELFHGRKDIFARRWYSKNSGKSGYQPVCLNEWDRQLCDKRKYKCTSSRFFRMAISLTTASRSWLRASFTSSRICPSMAAAGVPRRGE